MNTTAIDSFFCLMDKIKTLRCSSTYITIRGANTIAQIVTWAFELKIRNLKAVRNVIIIVDNKVALGRRTAPAAIAVNRITVRVAIAKKRVKTVVF